VAWLPTCAGVYVANGCRRILYVSSRWRHDVGPAPYHVPVHSAAVVWCNSASYPANPLPHTVRKATAIRTGAVHQSHTRPSSVAPSAILPKPQKVTQCTESLSSSNITNVRTWQFSFSFKDNKVFLRLPAPKGRHDRNPCSFCDTPLMDNQDLICLRSFEKRITPSPIQSC
jgi:hypothetical protein